MALISAAEPLKDGRLPAELERTIFEISALSRPAMVPKLMLVAWRVKEWVEPLLYRVIFLSDMHLLDRFPRFTKDVLLRAIETKPAAFFHDVRCLFLGEPALSLRDRGHRHERERTILTACRGLTDLAATSELATHADTLARMRLQHLTLHLDGLFVPPKRVEFSHPIFAHLTHLEVLGYESRRTQGEWAGLALLPCLTHFAFNDVEACYELRPVLQACEQLRCVVLHGGGTVDDEEDEHIRKSGMAEDPRFVLVHQQNFFTDWQRGAAGLDTFWDVAENFIAVKREGIVGALAYVAWND